MRKALWILIVLLALAAPSVAQTSVTISGMKREDDPAADKDRGFPVLVKRCDTSSATTASANGRLAELCSDANGKLYVTASVDNGSAVDANSYAIATLEATVTATGAATECAVTSTASTNATSCKASAGNFYGYEIYNTTTTVYYLRLYNLAAAPTCSSSTGFIRSIPIPPASAAGGVGGAIRSSPLPVAYTTGISWCLTGGGSSTDNTNAATGLYGAVTYK